MKHIEAIEFANAPLGKPSISVPPLRFTFFTVWILIRGQIDNNSIFISRLNI